MAKRVDDLGINNLKVVQETDYFCFGMDSVLLANFVNSSNSKNVILDFCSGSGVIPIIISAKKKYSKIFAVELQDKMYELLEENINLNSLENDIIAIKEDVKSTTCIRKKILDYTKNNMVDIIVCNPPYKNIGTGSINENEVKYIARHEVMCNLEDIFSSASKLLKSKGRLYLVHKPQRLVDLLTLARKYKLEAKTIQFVYPMIDKDPSIVLIEYVKGGGNEVKVLKPLIEYNSDGSYTDDIYSIYGMNKIIK